MKRITFASVSVLVLSLTGLGQISPFPAPNSRRTVAQHEKREKRQLKQHEKAERAACRNDNLTGLNCADLNRHEQAERRQLKTHQRAERRFRR